ncbi:MAPEG family protein [Pararhodobacter sp.]|uniref:MAPEG family protein n=1 Tax=Pararhodobacter sp. TaxID=2127056 RepID=UPI002AFE199C|nr:MAPEG family protein [Pararhodobacter sp.]
MSLIHLIAVLAVLQYLVFGFLVAVQRGKSGLKAPAVTGHDGFERMYRVQMNTLECLIAFLPMLLLSGQYWSAMIVAPIGAVYLIGRTIYWRAYVADPASRSVGFGLSMLPILLLLLLAGAGALRAMIGA